MTNRFRVYVRDRPRHPDFRMPLIGEIDEYTKVDAIVRHLDVGSFSLEMPYASPQARLIEPGRGIVIFVEGSTTPVFSGPIRQITLSRKDGDSGTLTVNGVCDNFWAFERLIRRDAQDRWSEEREGDWDGARGIPDGNGGATWIFPTNSAMWIWHAVLQNFNVLYLDTFIDTSRRVRFMNLPDVAPASATSLPPDDVWKGQRQNHKVVGEVIFPLAERMGYDLRFYWSPVSEKVEMKLEPMTDRSDTVVFDQQVGNLVSFQITSEAPGTTRVVMAGAPPTDDNPRRYYRYVHNRLHNPPGWVSLWDAVGDPSSWSDPDWGREYIEVFWNCTTESYVDVRDSKYHPTPNANGTMPEPPAGSVELAKFDETARAHFVENGVKGAIQLDIVDIPTCSFGTHYQVGDIVRCLVDTSILPQNVPDEDGVLRLPVREVHLSASADEMWKITGTVGTENSSSTPWIYRELRRVKRLVEETNERD